MMRSVRALISQGVTPQSIASARLQQDALSELSGLPARFGGTMFFRTLHIRSGFRDWRWEHR